MPNRNSSVITRLLIANRGEIARRVVRTCDELEIETVAVFSDPDRNSPVVDEATYAVALGGSTSAETYLDATKVIDAARRSGADAIHPGYGFLAENADFAEAVIAAGLVWVGPTPTSMRSMALKVEAKRIAAAAGVPLVPGAELEADVSDDALHAAATSVGYPLLVKASAGGGGKGMRIVRSADALIEAVAGARREAASSFGDPTVFLERYLEKSRHVEVQVFGEAQGNVVHLFERECSIQRRHQKIVEESPSPGATDSTLHAMYSAALSLARAIGYVGAGTVEFLVSGEGASQEFYFLEMNTRLQVEHPVTEMVTGLDLVEWQLAVAQGEPLPLSQKDIKRTGHAIEVRLYAEDPARDFLPSSGTITDAWQDWADALRIDSGIDVGSVVSSFYDPMLAKVIAHADSRSEAAGSLVTWLRRLSDIGVTTNAPALAAILGSEPFLAGDTTTSFLEENPSLLVPVIPTDVRRRHLLVCAVAVLDSAPSGGGLSGVPTGWRNVAGSPETAVLSYRDGGDETHAVIARAWARAGATYWICPDATPADALARSAISSDVRFEGVTGLRLDLVQDWGRDGYQQYRVEIDGIRESVYVRVTEDSVSVDLDGWDSTYTRIEPWEASAHDAAHAGPTTPVPGTVTHVAVAVGDLVAVGAALVVLEAMKMEHTIRADIDGIVTEIHVGLGQSVDAHTLVATLVVAP